MKIRRIQKVENNSHRYDLSVEGNENFFANGILVHNCTMYSDYMHARSTSDKKHWSKSWIKNFHAKIAHEIPPDWRLILENMYAKHSIHYKNLESYCYGISIWDGGNRCLSWDETTQFFDMLGIIPVPVIYRGPYVESVIRDLYKPKFEGNDCEGYVVRVAGDFHFG